MFSTLWNALYSKLNSNKSSLGLVHVWNYHPVDPINEFPSALVLPKTTTAEVLDTCDFRASVPFLIRVYSQNLSDVGAREATIRQVCDSIITMLANDFKHDGTYLNGLAVGCKFAIERGYTEDQQPMRVCDITATFITLI